MVGMAEVGAPISLDGVAVHPDCWCICLCYLHFAPENPEDGEIYLLLPAHPGCPGQGTQSRKMVVCVYVCVFLRYTREKELYESCVVKLERNGRKSHWPSWSCLPSCCLGGGGTSVFGYGQRSARIQHHSGSAVNIASCDAVAGGANFE